MIRKRIHTKGEREQNSLEFLLLDDSFDTIKWVGVGLVKSIRLYA